MENISIVKNHVEAVDTASILKVYELLKDPQSPYRDTIEEIRSLYALSHAAEADKLKKTLPGFTCSGIFNKRRKTDNLVSYSGMLILDLDDLSPIRLNEVRAIVEAIPYTYLSFVSPSGFGLKAVVKVNATVEQHKIAYEQVKKYYEEETMEKFDKTSDVARLTYISYDPDTFLNEESAVFQVACKTPKKRSIATEDISKPVTESHKEELKRCFNVAVKFTERTHAFEEGNRNNFVFQLACNGNRYGIPLEWMLEKCIDEYANGWEEQEIRNIINNAFSNYADEAGTWKHLLYQEYLDSRKTEKKAMPDPDESTVDSTPVIPLDIIKGMPAIIRDIAMMLESERERDTFVTGALSVLSGCLRCIEGIYDGSIVYCNLYSFIIAPASSGKGVLRIAKELGDHLHEKLLEESKLRTAEYERALEEYQDAKKKGVKDLERPEKPPFVMLFVPGNSSSAAIYDHLNESSGIGVICETEADTVNNCIKNDWGNYSDLLRKAFHHEKISSRRKTDNKIIEVRRPRLSVALSSTTSQVQGLIKSAEDGLFSRFVFYKFHIPRLWRDVSPANGKSDLPKVVAAKAMDVTAMVLYLMKYPSEFDLTEQQWKKLNKHFGKWLNDVSCFVTEEAGATVMRLGLIAFRIAMVLSAINKYLEGGKELKLICNDDHFNMAMGLVDIYLQHAMVMYKELPVTTGGLDGKLKTFFEILPTEFTRDMAKKLAVEKGLKVSDSWVDKWLKRLVVYGYLIKPDYNSYRKIQANKGSSDSPEDIISPIRTTPVIMLPAPKEERAA